VKWPLIAVSIAGAVLVSYIAAIFLVLAWIGRGGLTEKRTAGWS